MVRHRYFEKEKRKTVRGPVGRKKEEFPIKREGIGLRALLKPHPMDFFREYEGFTVSTDTETGKKLRQFLKVRKNDVIRIALPSKNTVLFEVSSSERIRGPKTGKVITLAPKKERVGRAYFKLKKEDNNELFREILILLHRRL